VTVFHLIRHGLYDAVDRVLTGQSPGRALNAAGLAQAERLGAALAGLPIAAVVASPLQRTRETAAPIARSLRLEVVENPGFLEVDYGAWTGLTAASLDGDPIWQLWNTARGIAATPGGEAMVDVQARATGQLRRLHAEMPDAEIAVVSHCDVIRAMLCAALGMPLDMLLRLDVAPASRSVVVLHPYGVEVRHINLPID